MFFKRKEPKHYIVEAEALFGRFAARHRLSYNIGDAPVEVLWKFPVQEGLYHPIVLCLQNNDELSFGVGDFWSYKFPYPQVKTEFERLISAWVEGRARTVPRSGWISQTVDLQVIENGVWRSAYAAGSLTFQKLDPRILMNTPA